MLTICELLYRLDPGVKDVINKISVRQMCRAPREGFRGRERPQREQHRPEERCKLKGGTQARIIHKSCTLFLFGLQDLDPFHETDTDPGCK